MSRSGSKINRKHFNENRELIEKCDNLCRKITKKGHINRENLLLALSIRLNIKINEHDFNKFDKSLLEEIEKELEYMLTID